MLLDVSIVEVEDSAQFLMIIADLPYFREVLPFFVDAGVVKALNEDTDMGYSVPPQGIFSYFEKSE